ncbi:hypothetical protein [Streptomyces sp. NPDC056660]|uniref:hypothetical protein n=1 Tax=Streptomyces sp. NPDC056660 TaxID=3345897 RepID=UPI0036B3CAE0
MILVIPAEGDLTMTVVLPAGVRDRDAATAAALLPLTRAVLGRPQGPDSEPVAQWLAVRGAAADVEVRHETVAFRCRMPPPAVGACVPVFVAAVTHPLPPPAQPPPAPPAPPPGALWPGAGAPCAATARVRRLLFGDHPLVRTADQEPDSVPELTPAYCRMLSSGAPSVVVAGDGTLVPQALQALSTCLPKAGHAGEPVTRTPPSLAPVSTAPVSTGGVNLLATGGGARARIAVGGLLGGTAEPDASAARVLVELFGPGTASLLRETLRTDLDMPCELEADHFSGKFSVLS